MDAVGDDCDFLTEQDMKAIDSNKWPALSAEYSMHGIRGVIRTSEAVVVWVEWEGWCHLTHNSWEFLRQDMYTMLLDFEYQVPVWYQKAMTLAAAMLWHEIWYRRVRVSDGLDLDYFHRTHQEEHKVVEEYLIGIGVKDRETGELNHNITS